MVLATLILIFHPPLVVRLNGNGHDPAWFGIEVYDHP